MLARDGWWHLCDIATRALDQIERTGVASGAVTQSHQAALPLNFAESQADASVNVAVSGCGWPVRRSHATCFGVARLSARRENIRSRIAEACPLLRIRSGSMPRWRIDANCFAVAG